MLQALAVQSCAPSGTAKQKPFAHHVATAPNHVAYPLHAKHGVKNIEGNHRQTMYRIGAACGHEGRHGAYFANTFLEYLAVAGFAIGQ